MGAALLSLLLPPLGACLPRFCLPGVTRPSAALPRAGSLQPLRGFALNAGHPRTVPVGELAIPFGTRADGQGCLDGKRLAGPYGCAPKGQPGSPKAGLLPAQGNALGCGWFSKRAPKGQKPWELRFCLPGVTRPSTALPRAGSLQPLRGFSLNAGLPVGQGGARGAQYVSSFLSCPRFGSRARRR